MEDFNKVNLFIWLICVKVILIKVGMIVILFGFNKLGVVVVIVYVNVMIMFFGGICGFKVGNIVDVILIEFNSFEEELILWFYKL